MSNRPNQPPHLKAIAEARSSPVAVAARMKELRNQKELSQAGLAKLAQISQQAVAAIETARVDTPRHLEVISEALGVHPQYIRTGRMPGIPLFTSDQLMDRSAYPRPDSEYGLTHAMLVPHHPTLSALAFALVVPDDSCAGSGAVTGSYAVIEPDLEPVPGSLIVVHYRKSPTLRRYKDTGGEPKYVPDSDLHASLDAQQAGFIGVVVEIRHLLFSATK